MSRAAGTRPASYDLCGIFVVPLAKNFQRTNGQLIAAIFREVTLPDEQFREVAATWRVSRECIRWIDGRPIRR